MKDQSWPYQCWFLNVVCFRSGIIAWSTKELGPGMETGLGPPVVAVKYPFISQYRDSLRCAIASEPLLVVDGAQERFMDNQQIILALSGYKSTQSASKNSLTISIVYEREGGEGDRLFALLSVGSLDVTRRDDLPDDSTVEDVLEYVVGIADSYYAGALK